MDAIRSLAEAAPYILGGREAVMHEHFGSDEFQRLLARTLARVSIALDQSATPYLAFSGGKDSIAVCALCDMVADGHVRLYWSDDELEYAEIVAYMTEVKRVGGDRLIIGTGWARHAGWFDPWTDAPFWREPLPGTESVRQDADTWMAHRGYDLTLTGVRAEESAKRRDWLLRVSAKSGAGIYNVTTGTGTRCCPIWDWTADDVWALIAGWQLGFPRVYRRLWDCRASRYEQRVGPLPLAPRDMLAAGWPDMLARLEARYGPRWT